MLSPFLLELIFFMAEFAMKNTVHTSTGLTPYFVSNARHPRSPAFLGLAGASTLGGRERPSGLASDAAPAADKDPLCTPDSITASMVRMFFRLLH